MFPDDLELDDELMVVLGRVALFGIEIGLLGQFSKGYGSAPNRPGSFFRSGFSCFRFASSEIASPRRPHFSQCRFPCESV